ENAVPACRAGASPATPKARPAYRLLRRHAAVADCALAHRAAPGYRSRARCLAPASHVQTPDDRAAPRNARRAHRAVCTRGQPYKGICLVDRKYGHAHPRHWAAVAHVALRGVRPGRRCAAVLAECQETNSSEPNIRFLHHFAPQSHLILDKGGEFL